jgi:hypothetical protein
MTDLDLWTGVSDLTPANTIRYVRDLPDSLPNSLNQLLPDRTIQGIETETTRVTRRRLTAKYRAWNSEVAVGERPIAVARDRVQLPPLGQLLILQEWERIMIELARNGGNFQPLLGQIVDQVYDDLGHNTEATRNRIEVARGDFLLDGKFTLTENGVTMEYDAVLPATHVVAPLVDWDDPDATPLSDEIAWNRLVRKDSQGAVPSIAITDIETIDFMRDNAEYRSAFWPTLPAVNAPRLALGQLNDIRAREGLPPVRDYDHELEVDGIDTRVLPKGQFIFVTPTVGETQYGWTTEVLSLLASNSIDLSTQDAPGLVGLAWKKPNPVTGYSQVAATSMPVAGDINGLYSTSVRTAA